MAKVVLEVANNKEPKQDDILVYNSVLNIWEYKSKGEYLKSQNTKISKIYNEISMLNVRIDDLEEEIWSMEDSELEACPYCERVYTIEDEVCDDFGKVIEEIVLEKVELNNSNNELHDEVQNHLKDLEEENSQLKRLLLYYMNKNFSSRI